MPKHFFSLVFVAAFALFVLVMSSVSAQAPCPSPTVSASPNPACTGQTVLFSATINQSAIDNPSFSWTGPGGFTSNQQNPTITNVTIANAGIYCVTVSGSNCTTSSLACVTLNVNPIPPTPVITAPATVTTGSTSNNASVTFHAGSTYFWTITNGTITSGQGTSVITFTAGVVGNLVLNVSETSVGCTSSVAILTIKVLGNVSVVIDKAYITLFRICPICPCTSEK